MIVDVSLNELSFFAYHGIHQEENKIGNRYTLNITVSLFILPDNIHKIDQTIDYSKVANIAAEKMQIATPLLETVAYNIANQILTTFSKAEKVKIELFKHNPPMGLICQSSSVKIELGR